jgi:hypothetical protein
MIHLLTCLLSCSNAMRSRAMRSRQAFAEASTGSGLLRMLERRRNPALIPGLDDDAAEMRLVVFRGTHSSLRATPPFPVLTVC